MFVHVKHGFDQEIMVNSNCKVINFFRFLRKKLELDSDVDLELCDLTGDIKHLDSNKDALASSLLREKERYVLLKIERKTFDMKPVFLSLLESDSVITEDFLMKLNSIKKLSKSFNANKVVKTKASTSTKRSSKMSLTINNNTLSLSPSRAEGRAEDTSPTTNGSDSFS